MNYESLVMFGLILVSVGLIYTLQKNKKSRLHIKKITSAKKVLKKVSEIESDAQIFAYLRKIDPFSFEELILICYAKKGHKIKRNKKYTGDGGIDGQVWIDGQHYFIQAKRYSSSINPSHVKEFLEVVNKKPGSKGLFVHTGRTGAKSKAIASDERIEFISGDKLINLIKQ